MRVLVIGALLLAAVAVWPGRAPATAPPWTERYTVHWGDSLSGIAARYGVSVTTLARVNGLSVQKPLLAGAVLRVPGAAAAVPASHATYLVQPGDTLSGIAVHYRVSVAQLAAANGLDSAGVLLAGTRLRIPAAGSLALDLAHVAESNPYRSADVGYDVSYPNCEMDPPGGREFAVVGLTWGRPFTANPCFARQWAATKEVPASVYVNTAYSATMFDRITAGCTEAAQGEPGGASARRAYALGCSEAESTLQLLGGRVPHAIWLDVEPDNTWSSRPALNVATITGVLEQLLRRLPATPVGVYSRESFWRGIVGDWSSLAVPEWIALDFANPNGCGRPFAAGPVWLSQQYDGQVDRDIAC